MTALTSTTSLPIVEKTETHDTASTSGEQYSNEVLALGPLSTTRNHEDPEKAFKAIRTNASHRSTDRQGPITRTVTAQDWTGPDDPENPMNWSLASRIYHTTIPALMGLVVTFGSSVYTPGVPDIIAKFHISSTVALLGLALYVLGLGFGPVLAAPMSETYGRRAVYLISLPISALFTLGAGFSHTFASFVVCRFFAGFFGSPTLAVGAGTNADIWPPVHRAFATVLFILAPFAGPALGPVVGGFAAENKGWRWTQWPILFFFAGTYIYSIFMKETYKKIILRKRAKKLGIPPPQRTTPPGMAGVKVLLTITLIRPVNMIFTEPIVGFFSLYIAFNFAVLFGFFDAFPIVFQGVYGFDSGHAGLVWLAVLVGCIFAVFTVIIIDRLTYRKHFEKSHKEGRLGIVSPEHRLYAAMVGSLGLPVGIFWFAWTARGDVHWISPVLAAIPFAWGNLCVFVSLPCSRKDDMHKADRKQTSAALYLVDTYGPTNGASAMAANGLARYALGAAFPLFTIQSLSHRCSIWILADLGTVYHKLGIAWASSLLGFIAIALLPIPWVLFKYGSRIRSMSKFDTIQA
ncbi:hypothetical protein MMC06_002828 [Schaereria dolodes]|nr:hypothetical protein [Schaereria dolodes]